MKTAFCIFCIFGLLLPAAPPSRSSSSSSSRSSSSSSRSYSSPSRSSSSSRPSSSRSSSSPSRSTPSTSRPSSTTSSKSSPKYSSSSSSSSSPKYSAPSSTIKPVPVSTPSSRRPDAPNVSRKAIENRRAATYQETAKATEPPKSSYTTKSGQTVKINDTVSNNRIREKPYSYHTPEARNQRFDRHVHVHHYSQPSSWYYSQPYYHVGGGYSSLFWYMMITDWNADRRANWLYHNKDKIEADAYKRGAQDAQVQARLAALEKSNTPRDPNYIDPEFKENPSDMYDQEYVNAVYNPKPLPSTPAKTTSGFSLWNALCFLVYWSFISICFIGVAYAFYYFFFVHRF